MDLFSRMLKQSLGPWLKTLGFVRAGHRFTRQTSGNWEIVEFQKSSRSTNEQTLFTVNLGLISSRVAKIMDPSHKAGPQYPTWQWKQRIGILTPEARDLWWSLITESDQLEASQEVRHALTLYGFPALDAVTSDEDLRDRWLSGTSPGISHVQRLMYLSCLLATIGPREQLNSPLGELHSIPSSAPYASTARAHLERLEQLLSEPRKGA